MKKREINFGIVGCGLMGREFASAAARWCHLLDLDFLPKIVAVCDSNANALRWFENSHDNILVTRELERLLERKDIEAIYCAVPHHLHADLYSQILSAGKHLLGEKPFGCDKRSNDVIQAAVRRNPKLLVRCSSEFPFYPGAQQIINCVFEKQFGRIIDVQAGLLHSSDLDPLKHINWKRTVAHNGPYGSMGDLGMHVVHIPLRVGWYPLNVRAMLSNIMTERPNDQGQMVPCDTWDNSTLLCDVKYGDQHFPMTLVMNRLSPGESNTWYIKIFGTELSAMYSTKEPKTLRMLPYKGGSSQDWRVSDMGYKSAYPTITNHIFEFGFTDAVLQMWAAFCDELANGGHRMKQPFYCATPLETAQSHEIFTAALESTNLSQVVELACDESGSEDRFMDGLM